MTITSLPTKTAGSLGAALTNIRAAVPNEHDANHLEELKNRVIELFSEIGKTDGSTPSSLNEWKLALQTIFSLTDTVAPNTTPNTVHVYAKDNGGTNGLWALTDDGVEHELTLSGFAVQEVDNNGGVATTLVSKNAVVLVDLTAGEVNLTLPSAALSAGRVYIFRKTAGTDGSSIIVTPDGADVIDGAATWDVPGSDRAYGEGIEPTSAILFCDGAAWWSGPARGNVSRTAAFSSNGTLPNYDAFVEVNVGGGSVTLTLPSGTAHYGRRYVIVKGLTVSSNTITLDRTSPTEINGVDADLVLPGSTSPNGHWFVFCDEGGSWWVSSAPVTTPQRSVTASATLADYDEVIWVTANTVTLTLAAPVRGRQYLIVKAHAGANKITLARYASEQINGAAASYDLPGSTDAARGRWHVSCDGSVWEVG